MWGGGEEDVPLIFIGHLYVVDPDVLAPDIDAVKPTLATAPDDRIVDFAIRARVHYDKEFWGIHQGNVVETEVGDLSNPDTGSVKRSVIESADSAVSLTLVSLTSLGLQWKVSHKVFASAFTGSYPEFAPSSGKTISSASTTFFARYKNTATHWHSRDIHIPGWRPWNSRCRIQSRWCSRCLS